jgi:WD40 repeat protein
MGDKNGAVILWDATTGQAEKRMRGDANDVVSLTFSADGARLASGSADGFIRVWDVETGASLRTFPEPDRYFCQVAFSPLDSRRLAGVGVDGPIELYDVDSGAKSGSIRGCKFVVFSPDGCTIATTGRDQRVFELQMIDAESGKLRFSMVGHEHYPQSTCFSMDGSKLASGSVDGACKVWDSSTGALLRSITVCARAVNFSVSWGRDFVKDSQCAFAMGHHPRLGEGSRVLDLDVGVIRIILDRV